MEPLRDLESEGHGEIHTVAFKVNDLEFQGHVIEIENSITFGFLDPETIPMKNFTKKFGREDQNPGGVATPPPLSCKR